MSFLQWVAVLLWPYFTFYVIMWTRQSFLDVWVLEREKKLGKVLVLIDKGINEEADLIEKEWTDLDEEILLAEKEGRRLMTVMACIWVVSSLAFIERIYTCLYQA